MEHHSNIVPWQQLAERSGCRVRFAPITDDGYLDLAALARVDLTSGRVWWRLRRFPTCWEPSIRCGSGVEAAHAAGALVLVDAAQSVPHAPTDVQAWEADFVAFSGHKMLGPSGVGVL